MYPELLIRIWMSSKKKNASMIIGLSLKQEICPIRGQVSLSLLYPKKKHSKRIYVRRERLTIKQLTSRQDHLWSELWEIMGIKLNEKQQWSHEKLHPDDVRKLRRIKYIIPEVQDSKETIKELQENHQECS